MQVVLSMDCIDKANIKFYYHARNVVPDTKSFSVIIRQTLETICTDYGINRNCFVSLPILIGNHITLICAFNYLAKLYY